MCKQTNMCSLRNAKNISPNRIIIVIIITILIANVLANSRVKRKVVFTKSSKFFFRLNGKDNVINSTEIFAHGWAIRVNYDLPESILRRHKFFKRDIQKEIENVPNESASLGISCILKHLCETLSKFKSPDTCGFFCEMGNIINRSPGIEADFFRSFLEKCDYHSDTCLDSPENLVTDNFG